MDARTCSCRDDDIGRHGNKTVFCLRNYTLDETK